MINSAMSVADVVTAPSKQGAVDVVVVGAGGAGLAAAIEAARSGCRVLVLCAGSYYESKTCRAQGGLQASIGEDDSPENHIADTISAGGADASPELVQVMASKAADTIRWLEGIGVEFDKDSDGKYTLTSPPGTSKPRVLSIGSDATGRHLVDRLVEHALASNVQISEYSIVRQINQITDGFEVKWNIGDQLHTVSVASVVLATGGVYGEERKAGLSIGGCNNNDVPDSIELTSPMGVEAKNVDLVQHHPTGVIYPPKLRRERLPETLRVYGARFLNNKREEFVDSLLTRGKLTQAIVSECQSGRGVETEDGRVGVWLTTTEIDKQHGAGFLRDLIPNLYMKFRDAGIDPSKEDVIVYPVVHYSLGGVCIDKDSSTGILGLFAAGETTYGVHGSERLMGNSLIDIFVFGRIAGKNAAISVKRLEHASG